MMAVLPEVLRCFMDGRIKSGHDTAGPCLAVPPSRGRTEESPPLFLIHLSNSRRLAVHA